MTIDDKDMINSILESVSRIDYIKPEEIGRASCRERVFRAV